MKLYIIPIAVACNARCPFCITEFKDDKTKFGATLDIKNLDKIKQIDIDKIEITGGGEPFLHPRIAEIITFCAKKAPSQIYTHGGLLSQIDAEVLKKLSFLCISRCHYNDCQNLKLMGVEQELDLACSLGVPIKLSLVLCRSGINTPEEVKRYLDWANQLTASKVVIRQLFEFNPDETGKAYLSFQEREYVSTLNLPEDLGITDYKFDEQGNPIFQWDDMEVEAEGRTCACEANYPILRPDGQIYLGWTDRPWSFDSDRRS